MPQCDALSTGSPTQAAKTPYVRNICISIGRGRRAFLAVHRAHVEIALLRRRRRGRAPANESQWAQSSNPYLVWRFRLLESCSGAMHQGESPCSHAARRCALRVILMPAGGAPEARPCVRCIQALHPHPRLRSATERRSQANLHAAAAGCWRCRALTREVFF